MPSARRQRKLSSDKPLLSVFSALVVLATYGAIWSSSRGHHPYRGPSLDVVGLVYILVAVSALVTRLGLPPRHRRRHRALAAGRPRPWRSRSSFAMFGVYTFDGALKYDGFNASVVYGVFDAAAPWLVVGAVLAGYAAAKEDWWKLTGPLADDRRRHRRAPPPAAGERVGRPGPSAAARCFWARPRSASGGHAPGSSGPAPTAPSESPAS